MCDVLISCTPDKTKTNCHHSLLELYRINCLVLLLPGGTAGCQMINKLFLHFHPNCPAVPVIHSVAVLFPCLAV